MNPKTTYKNKAEALRELKRLAFKIGKSKFYKDCSEPGKNKGLCLVESDGSITEHSLKLYINNPGSRLLSSQDVNEETQNEKQRVELQIKKYDERLKSIEVKKAEGTLIDREEAVAQMCGLVEALKSAFEQLCALKAPEWAEKVTQGADFLGASVWQDFQEELRNLASYDEIIIKNTDSAGAEA